MTDMTRSEAVLASLETLEALKGELAGADPCDTPRRTLICASHLIESAAFELASSRSSDVVEHLLSRAVELLKMADRLDQPGPEDASRPH